MNYLAHIYLADNNDESILGNFLGDFVNKSLENPMDELINNYESLEDDFKAFFPEEIEYAKKLSYMFRP